MTNIAAKGTYNYYHRWYMGKRQSNVLKYILVSLFATLILVASIAAFLYTAMGSLNALTYGRIQTLAGQKVAVINGRMDSRYGTLTVVASYLSEDDPFADRALTEEFLLSAAEAGGFAAVGLADGGGDVLISGGEAFEVSGNYFSESMQGREALDFVKSGEGYVFVLSVPLYSGEAVSGVVFAIFSSADFLKYVVNIEDDDSYLLITDSSGVVLTKDEACYSVSEGGSLFDLLSEAELGNRQSLINIKEDFASQKANVFSFEYGGQNRVMTYVPIGRNGWYAVNVSDGGLFSAQNKDVLIKAAILMLEIFAVFGCLIWYIIAESVRKESLINSEKRFYEINEANLRKLEAFSDSVIFECDLVEDTLRFNDNFRTVFGRECLMQHFSDLMFPNDYFNPEDVPALVKALHLVAQGRPQPGGEYRIKNADGQYVWTFIEALLLRDRNGVPRKIMGKINNIDRHKRAMSALRTQAENDRLTDLYNHVSMKAKVDEFLSSEQSKQLHAFMLIDVDDFKLVNDTYGHYEGDLVLKVFGREISKLYRADDVVGRLGGDEFAVFIKNIGSKEKCIQKAEQTCRVIADIRSDSFENLRVTCSVGVALITADGYITYDDYYQQADESLYIAKANGKNGFHIE